MEFESLDEFSEEFNDFECPDEASYSEQADIIVDGEFSHEFIALPEINDMGALISVTDIFGGTSLFCSTLEQLRAIRDYINNLVTSLEEMEEAIDEDFDDDFDDNGF